MTQYGLFSDESASWEESEAVEAGFTTWEEAEAALAERYSPEDELTIHEVEEPEEVEADEEGDENTEEEGDE